MSALGKLLRSTAFRLLLAYLLVFTVFAFFTIGYVAWNAGRVLDDQIVGTIEAEITGLSEQYRLGGLRRLVAIVERRARQPGASLYLLTTPAGERIAGNVDELPSEVATRPSQANARPCIGVTPDCLYRETPYGRTGDPDTVSHEAIVRVFTLAGGFRLLVGRDVEERARLREVIRRAFGWSLLLVGALGLLGGWFVTRRVLKRVDDMTETTRTIMAGDLGGRLGVRGSGDEFDRLAQNLNAMLDRIGELMTGMREVSDNIAHDLKTPLTRLRNKADEALRNAKSPEELRAALDATIEESDNLIRIFNALLMIARLEAGNAGETLSDFDAAEVARGVAELYEAVAEEAGVPLEVAVEPDLPVRGNRELLGQAVANLLDNALKYGRPADRAAAPRVSVSAGKSSMDGGRCVTIAVADRGPGIPESERGRVTERFVRLESARSRPGFGLGLSLAAAVARLHGGALRLEDNAPGLRAVLELPLSPLPEGGVETASAVRVRGAAAGLEPSARTP
ncbi:MAG TPA: HAMP domain-containing sensor histidine kinase [Beijerinckiaceae bacterium]